MILYGKKGLMVTSVSQTGNFWWSLSHKLFTPSPTKISASPSPDIVPPSSAANSAIFPLWFFQTWHDSKSGVELFDIFMWTFCRPGRVTSCWDRGSLLRPHCALLTLLTTKEWLWWLGGFWSNDQNILKHGGFLRAWNSTLPSHWKEKGHLKTISLQ